MASHRSGPSRSSQTEGAAGGRDLKDNIVPRFDNQMGTYKEWRKRVMLYARKLQLQGRQNETALNVLATLDGVSWTQCEDLELSELEKADGLDMLLARLDAQWSYSSCGESHSRPSWSTAPSSSRRCVRSRNTRCRYLMLLPDG